MRTHGTAEWLSVNPAYNATDVSIIFSIKEQGRFLITGHVLSGLFIVAFHFRYGAFGIG